MNSTMDPWHFSHKKEFYRDSGLANFDFFEYNGQIYYINNFSKLCVSDLNGENIRMLAELDEDYFYIAVNDTGIYLYTEESFRVQRFDLSGRPLGKYRITAPEGEEDELYFNVYFCGSTVYCTSEKEMGDGCCILSLDTVTGRKTKIYSRASRVRRLSASSKYLAFYARYEKEDASDEGWMLIDLAARKIHSLSNPKISPEKVIRNPDYYNDESWETLRKRYHREIKWVDLNREIFWQESAEGGDTAVWQACSISDGAPRSDIPQWRTNQNAAYAPQEYFDGSFHFFAPSYYKFSAIGQSGQVIDWPLDNGGQAECDKFAVMGGKLFMNDHIGLHDTKRSIFPLSVEMPQPERLDWFSDPIPNPAANIPIPPPLVSACPALTSDGPWDLETVKTLGATDIKYNICTFGAGFNIGLGMQVNIEINGRQYQGRMHNSTKGRLDGLKQLYTEQGLTLGCILSARYWAATSTIYLTVMGTP